MPVVAPELTGLLRGFSCTQRLAGKESLMLWTIIGILLLLWVLGFAFHIAGGLIHILLVIAVVVGLFQLFTGRRV